MSAPAATAHKRVCQWLLRSKGFPASSALLWLIVLQARLLVWGLANPTYAFISLAAIAFYAACLTWLASLVVRRLSLLYAVLLGALSGGSLVPLALFPDAILYAVQGAETSPLATVGLALVAIYCAVGAVATASCGAVWFGTVFQAVRFAASGRPTGGPLLTCALLSPWFLVSGGMLLFWSMTTGPLPLQTASIVFWGTTLLLSSVMLLWALVALVLRTKW